MTAPGYCGLYINLGRSPERRRKFEKQLADLNLASLYTRFPAVDGSRLDLSGTKLRPGEVGVFHSHCQALERARSTGKCVHILEDDALLSEHVVPVIEDAIAANLFDRYDLLFTDMMVHCHIGFLKNMKSSSTRSKCRPPASIASIACGRSFPGISRRFSILHRGRQIG